MLLQNFDNARPDPICDYLRNHGIPEGPQTRRTIHRLFDRARRFPFVLRFARTGGPSVHPGGKPIRLSTHAGLSRPPAVVRRSGPPSVVAARPAPPRPSCALGVSQPRTVASVSVVPECLPLTVGYPAAPDAFASPEVGVGHKPRDDEDAFAAVMGANVGSTDRMPFRIVPERGKRPENSVETPGPKAGHVFHHDN